MTSEQLWDKALDPARLNCCVVCGKLISDDFWNTPKAMLYRRLEAGMIDGRMVQVHTSCMSEGKTVAEEQGLAWVRGAEQLNSPPSFPTID